MKKKFLLGMLGTALLLLTVGVTYSYFTGMVTGEGKKLTVTSTELKILFVDDSSLADSEIIPGWSESKSFSVKNESKEDFNYNIVFENLVNTFVTEGFLQYKKTSTSGYNMEGYLDIPKSSSPQDVVLAYDIDIEVGATHEYTIEFVYHNSDTVDQSEDMGKIFEGNLAITEGTVNPDIKYTVIMNSENGSITPTSAESIKKGSLEFNVTPNTGYDVTSMSVSCSPVANTTIVDNLIRVNDIRQDHECTVSFDKTRYTVDIEVINGSSDALNKVIEYGGSGSTTITPNYGYTLEGASVTGTGCSISGDTLTISNVTSNGKCTVTLAKAKYQVELVGTGIGTSNSPQEVEYEGTAIINFTLVDGYELGNSSINCDNEAVPSISGSVLTVSNVTANTTCTLSPVLKSYDVTLKVTGGTPTSEVKTVSHGGSTTFSISASTGYNLTSPTISCTGSAGKSISGSTVTISNVTASQTCTVTLKKKTYTVSVSSNNTSYGTVSPTSSTVSHGDNLKITLTEKGGAKYKSDDCGGTVSGNILTISNITESKSCTVTFAIETISLADAILRDNVNQGDRTDFSVKLDSDTTGKVFSTTKTSNSNKVYYYAGNTTNNWVKFANLYWRIIRTDENGGVRLLYVGESPNTTQGFIDNTNYQFNSESSTAYVGFMYGSYGDLANNRKNENNSIAKKKLDAWYLNNIFNKNDGKISYKYYLSNDAEFCNDRAGEGYLKDGLMYYAGYKRLVDAKAPTYKCGGNTSGGYYSDYSANDRFSAKNFLVHSIGLITADEIALAGGVYNVDSNNVWYNLNAKGESVTGNNSWWTMTPFRTDGYGAPRNYVISNTGKLGYEYNFSEHAIRPVITLNSEVLTFKGNGTSEAPYEVLYEKEVSSTLANTIKTVYPPKNGRTDFTKIDNDVPNLYTDTDDQGTTYYFSGNGSGMNNWVSFAGAKWRIIRINGNGSVRLLYAGSGSTDGYIGSSQAYNTSKDHPAYVGWKYTVGNELAINRKNGTVSNAYSTVESWYTTNITNAGLTNYVDTEAIYCNDRSLSEGELYSISSAFNYAVRDRLEFEKAPAFKCSDINDRFYSFGLMTADELVFAGGVVAVNNPSAYYYLNASGGSSTGSNSWWTMSPSLFNGRSSQIFDVGGSGHPGFLGGGGTVNLVGVVRPVVSLKSSVLVTGGSGTGSDPYTLTL